MHPARASSASAHDNLVITLIGDNSSALLNVTLPADSFVRTNEITCVRRDAIESESVRIFLEGHRLLSTKMRMDHTQYLVLYPSVLVPLSWSIIALTWKVKPLYGVERDRELVLAHSCLHRLVLVSPQNIC